MISEDPSAWKEQVKYLWNAELIFDELKIKKKLSRRQKKKIERKLREMTYCVWINSPKIRNNASMKEAVIQECLTDWNSFNRMSKGISNIEGSNPAKSIV